MKSKRDNKQGPHSVIAESRTAAEPEAPPRVPQASGRSASLLNWMAGTGDGRGRFVPLQAARGLEAEGAGGSLLAHLGRKAVSSAQGLQPLR